MKSSVFTTAALIIGIIIIINLLGNEYHFRWDLTEDKQYTLSPATRKILKDLEEPVTIKAYFSKNLPPHINQTRKDFQDLLVEYANLADGNILYEFIDPNSKEESEREAMEKGVRPALISVREKDQVKQQKAFLGATVQLGEKSEVIPLLQPGAAMEYALSTAIKKISLEKKASIGFLQGHGEPDLSEMQEVRAQLSVLYNPEEITFSDSVGVPTHINTLAIIRPTDSIPASDLRHLDNFIARGGRLLIAMNRVHSELRTLYGMPVNTGLEAWLKEKGVDVIDNFVIDAKCGSVTIPQQFGAFTLQANVSFPFVPIISTFSEHPITKGLETVMLEFASEIQLSADSSASITPLAFSSELSNTLPAPQIISLEKEWTEEDFPKSNVVVAAAIEKNTKNGIVRMVAIGDGDFAINGPPQQQRRLQADNVNLVSNAIDWLSDDTGLIELRTKGAIVRPIRELDDTTKSIIKYSNFLLPIVLAIGYGIYRAQKNRAIRMRRMSESYEIE